MPSQLNAYFLSAVLLVALVPQPAPGALLFEDPSTDSPTAGDPSGEEAEGPSDLLSDSPAWGLDITELHKEEFEREFQGDVKYDLLGDYNITSLPAGCSKSNLNMEACLHRLVNGLLFYTVLLKHVEKEYPGSQLTKQAIHYSGLLITCLRQNMRNTSQISSSLASSQEQLLKNFDNFDPFHRKMAAHVILYQLQCFLVDGKRAVRKREMLRGRKARLWNPSLSNSNEVLKRT